MAPQRTRFPSGEGPGDFVPLCYRLGENVFFAVEYSTKRLMADWVAHRLENRFGTDGCGSIPRNDMKCYFGSDDVETCMDQENKPGDPFHEDLTLKELGRARLGIGAFGTTGHDRGHLAPNQSFSWHICGAYKTFTMANMAPQLAALNRGLWAKLEEQVLFWAVTEGPIQVVTGTLFTTFPAGKFNVIRDGIVDRQTIVRTGQRLKPGASGLPGKVVKPTGFYKVIFRPGRDGEEDRAIAFLVPHTRTAMNAVFQQFVARIDVVESVTGFAFAVPEVLKGAGGQAWWLERKIPTGWRLRAATCSSDSPREGWQPELSRDERTAVCQASD
jgi:DNA/RNA endonuclease G (NUC1)